MSRKDVEKIEDVETDAKLITVRHKLRDKIGTGGIDKIAMQRAEAYIRDHDIDFLPYAQEWLTKLDTATAEARKAQDKAMIAMIARPIMGLKASGKMLKYDLVSEVSDIVLNLLEKVDSMNADTFEILAVHRKIIDVILASKMKGDGGKTGRILIDELYSACERYMDKHKIEH